MNNLNFIGAFVKACAAKSVAAIRSSRSRLDDNLPLGLRIGAMVDFEDLPFILARGAGHLIGGKPGAQKIVAYGRGELGDMRLHRFYLEDGVHFIQAAVDASNALIPEELRVFRLEREWFPQNLDEWSIWIHTNEDEADRYRIGFRTFDLSDGKDTSRVAASYVRMWPNPEDEAEQTEPVEFEERIYSDPFNTTASLLVRHQLMLYGRRTTSSAGTPQSTDGPVEWLMLCESEHGRINDPEEAVVTAYVGLIINPERRQLLVAA